MKDQNLEEIITALSEKYNEIFATANQKLVLAAEVRSLAERINNAPLNIGNYWFRTEEEKICIHFTERNGKQYADVDANNRPLKEWLSNILFINGYMYVLVEDILMQRDRNEWFFCTSPEHFRMLHLPEQEIFRIPKQVYLHTVLDIGEKESLTLTMLEPVLEHIKSKGVEIDNYIIGEILIHCYDGKTFHRYVEIMVPLKNKKKA